MPASKPEDRLNNDDFATCASLRLGFHGERILCGKCCPLCLGGSQVVDRTGAHLFTCVKLGRSFIHHTVKNGLLDVCSSAGANAQTEVPVVVNVAGGEPVTHDVDIYVADKLPPTENGRPAAVEVKTIVASAPSHAAASAAAADAGLAAIETDLRNGVMCSSQGVPYPVLARELHAEFRPAVCALPGGCLSSGLLRFVSDLGRVAKAHAKRVSAARVRRDLELAVQRCVASRVRYASRCIVTATGGHGGFCGNLQRVAGASASATSSRPSSASRGASLVPPSPTSAAGAAVAARAPPSAVGVCSSSVGGAPTPLAVLPAAAAAAAAPAAAAASLSAVWPAGAAAAAVCCGGACVSGSSSGWVPSPGPPS